MSKNNETEGIVLLLDVGIGMSTKIGNSTYLQTSVDIIQMMVQRKLFQSSKDELALILFGSNETANELWDGRTDSYSHVSVVRPLSLSDWKLLDYIQNNLHTTNIRGDILDALVVASNHFHEDLNMEKTFKEKRIIIFTDFSCSTDAEDKIDKISASLSKHNIRVDVINPFGSDDTENDKENENSKNATTSASANNNIINNREVKQMSKSQQEVYTILKKICDNTQGFLYSFDEALSLLSMYQAKSIRSAGTKYTLTIGKSFKLPIVSLIKCKEYKPDLFKFKKVSAKDPSVQLSNDRARFTKDDEQRDLNDKSDVIDAYRYGSTYVPIDNADNLRLKAEKCFSLLGFTKADRIKRHYYLGDSVNQIVPDPAYGESVEEAFVNMVHAMYLENVYGIVRRVFSSRSNPELGCLIPAVIDNSQPFLYYIQIPFEDDVRKFTLENFNLMKKFKPNEKQYQVIDDLIDSMDLSNKEIKSNISDNNNDEEDEEEEEPYDPHSTFNPFIQRMFQSIALRATNPDSELPDFDNHITATHLVKIGEKIRTKSTLNCLKRCSEEFPIKIDLKKMKKQDNNIFHQIETNENEEKVNENIDEKAIAEEDAIENTNLTEEVKKEEVMDDENEDLLNMM